MPEPIRIYRVQVDVERGPYIEEKRLYPPNETWREVVKQHLNAGWRLFRLLAEGDLREIGR